ncbi:peroxisomal biogenesis factor 11 [Coccomyxa subellipsoidea C-169]|uniref:Peroxisomal biogenesis factor 11 n=1 Tax=Coccomyxa subellipsoidea (strain C-169) TaxID=574566 RepID=I0YJH5_COCSC|nr:peroxisomal biogenesis factor 11 [Coccomyxa subellipsoidea C-169]EIE18544.1 peroxisomal biogenesis factor 11 [Coccomyxa subellipsoidea C-169]|eukprot:XP_005643088.1 peroxisomal biogenesis factor 11 [Coccomyxa subellipsoidea C-169]
MSSSSSTFTVSPPSYVTAVGTALPPPSKNATSGPYSQRKPDTLDKTVAFLAKRDGIDKVLKLIRYTSKLVLASALADSKSDLALRLKAFESSIGTSRKAYRLGKWLANVNAIRKMPLTTRFSYLEWLASGGEGVYYFVEQLTWLVKAGVIPQRHARLFSLISASAELVGYVGSITLCALRIAAALERERALTEELHRRKKQAEYGDSELRAEVRALQERRLLRTLALTQDISDALLAVSDIRDGKGRLSNPVLLASGGLISGLISARKNWIAL